MRSTSQWWQHDTPIGVITVVATSRGVNAIGFGERAPESIVGNAVQRRDRTIACEVDAWFRGTSQTFTVDIDLDEHLPPFARRVLDSLREEVPWGETVAYGELAVIAGRPGAARAVGSTMAQNPIPFIIPCHRVIAAGHKIGGYGGTNNAAAHNLTIKRWLLSREGATFNAAGTALAT